MKDMILVSLQHYIAANQFELLLKTSLSQLQLITIQE